MGVMKDISERAAANLKGGGPKKSSNKAGTISATDLSSAFKRIIDDLTKQELRRIVSRMNTVVRTAAVKNVRRASSATIIGESMKSKMTRGDWKNPSTVRKLGAAVGTEYLAGGWYGQVLKDRGATKPSMANNGGEVGRAGGGNTGIISKIDPRHGRIIGITGPRHGGDSSDNTKHGYNYAHMLEKGGNHKNWGKHPSQLEARPFLEPAARDTMHKQEAIVKKELIKWGKR